MPAVKARATGTSGADQILTQSRMPVAGGAGAVTFACKSMPGLCPGGRARATKKSNSLGWPGLAANGAGVTPALTARLARGQATVVSGHRPGFARRCFPRSVLPNLVAPGHAIAAAGLNAR